jgi:hypothetical protein
MNHITIITNIVSSAPVTANTGVDFDHRSWMGSLKAKNSINVQVSDLNICHLYTCSHLLAGVVA